jgi:hypothetical protein
VRNVDRRWSNYPGRLASLLAAPGRGSDVQGAGAVQHPASPPTSCALSGTGPDLVARRTASRVDGGLLLHYERTFTRPGAGGSIEKAADLPVQQLGSDNLRPSVCRDTTVPEAHSSAAYGRGAPVSCATGLSGWVRRCSRMPFPGGLPVARVFPEHALVGEPVVADLVPELLDPVVVGRPGGNADGGPDDYPCV